ncbi:nitrate reductase cytochrome c-type subunit [Cedecea sp. FDAARGOS_727]|uniref:nitrate reductase cytochrome c-type subunit n=1 Tax=Cedecea sp. FDAARGOS_727 TaxID=2545798 RepID=UPI00143EABD6|nr:nitrate reductase cytochrome c-type subunit [Cedecea sp. FDAARGOS_727]QIX96858.1 nitrate reductase cytochrome c-type subunit [Cedecea sp. FDAARGOS_727]
MKKQLLKNGVMPWIAGLLLAVSGVTWAANGADLSSSPEVSATEKGSVHMPKQQGKMALNYVNQPPLIPHSVDGYQVNSNYNRCMQCHGVEHYRTTGAPRISPTHFMDAEGKVLSNVAPRRYFCLQCHVPQTDAAPIVENTFTPSKGFGE